MDKRLLKLIRKKDMEDLLKLVRKKDVDGIALYEEKMMVTYSWFKIYYYIEILKYIINSDELKNDYDLFINFFWESKYNAIRRRIVKYYEEGYNISYIVERIRNLYNSLYEKKLYKQMNYVYNKSDFMFRDGHIKVHDSDLDERVAYVIDCVSDRFGMKTEFIRLFF